MVASALAAAAENKQRAGYTQAARAQLCCFAAVRSRLLARRKHGRQGGRNADGGGGARDSNGFCRSNKIEAAAAVSVRKERQQPLHRNLSRDEQPDDAAHI